jgi:acetyl-CoA carboxylase carboxyl transferase subunit alpha
MKMADPKRNARAKRNLKNHLKSRAGAPPAPAASENQGLSAIERVRLARNSARPQTLDYVDALISGFFELHGDRRFADDGAIVAGIGYFGKHEVAIVGHQRGKSTQERIRRNFGSAKPEGYRKAARVFELADRFRLPVITFVDTQGADPGLGAEERGQNEAIARNLELMARLTVPIIACVVGVGNVVLMQENACYSVITPEGCAAILWREASEENVAIAAKAMKLSAPDLLELGVIDEIIPEPLGGAHTAPAEAAHTLGLAVARHLERLVKLPPLQLRRSRERKFAAMGNAFLTRQGVENAAPIR